MGHLTVCEILLKFGANILQLDTLQRTILHHVTQAGEVCEPCTKSVFDNSLYTKYSVQCSSTKYLITEVSSFFT